MIVVDSYRLGDTFVVLEVVAAADSTVFVTAVAAVVITALVAAAVVAALVATVDVAAFVADAVAESAVVVAEELQK